MNAFLRVAAGIAIWLSAHAAWASAEEPSFPSTPAGKCASAFFAAWKEGSQEAMERFDSAHRAPDALTEKRVAERRARYEELREDLGNLTAAELSPISDLILAVTADSQNRGRISLTFTVGEKPPHHLESVAFEIGEPRRERPPVAGAETSSNSERAARMREFLDRLELLGFSGVVLAAKDGEILLEEGYGLADRETGREVTANTVFTIGSITKQFTGAAIAKLAQEGKLSFDDKIEKYFEGVPADKRGITLHQLLTHTAGFVDALGGDFDLKATDEWVLEQALASELLFAPGARHEYSNVGYSLLGMIVELASGLPYEDYLQKHLFEPAGMKRTGYLQPGFKPEECAIGYRNGELWGTVLGHPWLEDGPCWNLRANGCIHATAADMYRWHVALQSGKILSPETLERYQAPHADEGGGDSFYGYGWVNWKTPWGTRLLSHNGGNGIFAADCNRYVEDDAFLYVATNADMKAWEVMPDLEAILFGREYELPPPVAAIAPEELGKLAGTYRLASGSTLEVSAREGHLTLSADGMDAADLLQGGAGEMKDTARASERSLELLRQAFAGDLTGLAEASGRPLERLKEVFGQARTEQTDAFGPFERIEFARASPHRGALEIALRVHHQRGSWYALLAWEGDRIVGLGMEDNLNQGGTSADFFPTSASEFQSFRLGSSRPVNLRFDPAQKTLTILTPRAEAKAERAE